MTPETDIKKQPEPADALHDISVLVATLQREVDERMIKLRQLRRQLRQIETIVENEQKKERWIAFAMHLFFFVLGIAAASGFLKGCMQHVWSMFSR